MPVFVQPESEQACLLGMNVLPALGLTICRAGGRPLIVKEGSEPTTAHVRLLQSSSVPSLRGCYVRAQVDDAFHGVCETGQQSLLFEPQQDEFESVGLSR